MKRLIGLITILLLSCSVAFAESETISEREMERARIADANAGKNDREPLRKQVTDGSPGRPGSVQHKLASKSKVKSITEPADSTKGSDQIKPSRPTDQ